MKQAKRGKKAGTPPEWLHQVQQRLREGLVILLTALALFLFLALFTYSAGDPAWSQTSANSEAVNLGGHAGAWFADIFFYIFGAIAYFFPIMVGGLAWVIFKQRQLTDAPSSHLLLMRGVGFIGALISGCALAHLHFAQINAAYPLGAGGALGQVIGNALVALFNAQGTTLILLAVFLTGVTFATGLSWVKLMDDTGRLLATSSVRLFEYSKVVKQRLLEKYEAMRAKRWVEKTVKPAIAAKQVSVAPKTEAPKLASVPIFEPKKAPKKAARKAQQIPLFNNASDGLLPSVALLDEPKESGQPAYSAQALEVLSQQVEAKLADFGVDVKVVGVHPGPVITRFELELAPGVKASKITGLAKDLARSLSMVSVRVVEIIPGKPVVGLELPNVNRQTVSLNEVLSSDVYDEVNSPLALGLGKDIAGNSVVVDLSKMPHLLVAGTTGAGKSVGLNAMLLSMLFKAGPEHVRFIMIDPKMLELSVYDGIPHLLTPVVTDMKEAANALRWCVAEMERRYRLMAALGVRNVSGFNKKVNEAIKNKSPIIDPLWPEENEGDPPELEHLPYIVVVVDEFADMIMVVGKKVEELIARIAQKARAAGIHLILATQRPSVDVITGLIKANVPARIAFQVASRIDSRTILDQQGAEQLLGRGDMLYLPVGAGLPIRVHGAFVDDHEVHAVASDWKKRGTPEYQDDILSGQLDEPAFSQFSTPSVDDENNTQDSLYNDAVQVVLETRRASISMVQRRLRIGYNRAARLIEQMENEGLVSAMQSNGSREILVAENQS